MPEIKVIYKTSDFLVINKPAGILVHRPAGSKVLNSSSTVVDWLLENYPEIALLRFNSPRVLLELPLHPL